MKKNTESGSGVIRKVSAYISQSKGLELPPEVIKKAKHHILDTLAAIVSGSEMKPGRAAIKYSRKQKGVREAQVIGSKIVTSAINAAFANAMMAHADETDDSHEKSRTHPGCSIVPAALAIAERGGVDGMRFLTGVVVGYDIGCRIIQALGGIENVRNAGRSTHCMGGNFGAACAAASILALEEKQVSYLLSYTTHQAAGALHYVHDKEHIQKAFVFAALPALNGVMAAILIQSGFSGVLDPFTGNRNFLEAFSPEAKPERLIEGLGSHYEIVSTNIKKFSVGSPIQAPVDALLLLMDRYKLTARNVQSITVSLPDESAANTVNNRNMPDINLQYILAVTLLDGDLSFAAAHSYERMNKPDVLELKKRITLNTAPELFQIADTGRQAVVEVAAKDGGKYKEHVLRVRGTAENPMTTEEVRKKSSELMNPVLGKKRTQQLIDTILNIEKMSNIQQVRSLLKAL